jgi:hypothetical protein
MAEITGEKKTQMELSIPADLSFTSFEQACKHLGAPPDDVLLICPESLLEVARGIVDEYATEVCVLPTKLFASQFAWAVYNSGTEDGAIISCPSA